jgi:hypothetical protein
MGVNRGPTQTQIRQVQYSRSTTRYNGNRRRNNYNSDRGRESQGVGSSHLNPNIPPFQGRQEQVQPTHPNNNSEN